jgi:accessory gene regulator protein AgrB
MQRCINWLVDYCIAHNFIEKKMEPWLRYSIEKRVFTIIGLIPFLLLALLLTNSPMAISFIASFYFLRSCINGFHAKTIYGCLFISLATELLFLLGLCPILTLSRSIIINTICIPLILWLAPYNDSKIHFSTTEVIALKKRIRRRILVLASIMFISNVIMLSDIVSGLTAGIAMATFMLSLSYITKRRNSNEKHARKNQESS